MKNIQVNAHIKIHPGKLEEFKSIANSCVDEVRLKDKGTKQYDWFYNDEKLECVVRERYIDSEAVLEHIANVGELLGKMLVLSTISLDVYGSPSEKLKHVLDGWDVTYYYFEVGL